MTRIRFKLGVSHDGRNMATIDEMYQEIKGIGSPLRNAVGRIVKIAFRGNEPETLEFDFEMLPVAHGSLVFPSCFYKQLIETDDTKQIDLNCETGFGDSGDTQSILTIGISPKIVNQKNSKSCLYLDLFI